MAAMNVFQTSMLCVVSVREISDHEMMGLRCIYLKRHCQIALAKDSKYVYCEKECANVSFLSYLCQYWVLLNLEFFSNMIG